MSAASLALITMASMIAFAGNSLLCRLALATTRIDPASFTTIRLLSGALTLLILIRLRNRTTVIAGNWFSALALFTYAICFSYAYISLPAATGALLLFGAVQATMIGYGLVCGERLGMKQVAGIMLAATGLVWLLLPGVQSPSVSGSVLMLSAGVAWGIYSLRGRGAVDPAGETAGNFARSAPFAIAISLLTLAQYQLEIPGTIYALASGVIASGMGYALWYMALPLLRATTAATVQLSVPVIAAVGGVMFLAEPVTPRLVISATAILGGIALFILSNNSRAG